MVPSVRRAVPFPWLALFMPWALAYGQIKAGQTSLHQPLPGVPWFLWPPLGCHIHHQPHRPCPASTQSRYKSTLLPCYTPWTTAWSKPSRRRVTSPRLWCYGHPWTDESPAPPIHPRQPSGMSALLTCSTPWTTLPSEPALASFHQSLSRVLWPPLD